MNNSLSRAVLLAAVLGCGGLYAGKKQKAPEAPSALDRYIEEATAPGARPPAGSPGSAWSPAAPLGDLASDFRASQVNDSITIAVVESATAVASGTTKTQR